MNTTQKKKFWIVFSTIFCLYMVYSSVSTHMWFWTGDERHANGLIKSYGYEFQTKPPRYVKFYKVELTLKDTAYYTEYALKDTLLCIGDSVDVIYPEKHPEKFIFPEHKEHINGLLIIILIFYVVFNFLVLFVIEH